MIVEITSGRVRGVSDGRVGAFLGMPYAEAERFGAPRSVTPWRGVRDAVAPGPAAPQPPSRLARVMGPGTAPQSEDCLSLNVWAPAGSGHPVLVFLHGGGFLTGSGGFPWYDGAEFTAEGDVVVVTANYRLGALGYLRLPGMCEGNMGLLDNLAALNWVRDNISAFGGDPANVTVAGQSAGAVSILALLSGDAAYGLFRRAIVQSAPVGMLPATPDEAARVGGVLLQELGIGQSRAGRIVDVPVAELLAAQSAVARRTAGPTNPVPPFQLVTDGTMVAADPVEAIGWRGADGVEILMGATRDEAAAFFAGERDVIATVTDQMFHEPTRRLANLLTARGEPPWLYRFDWHPGDSPFGACHCIELPFVLGHAAAWRHAPMLDGARPSGLLGEMRRSWIGFVRHGDPGWARGTTHRFTGRAVR
ncbi:carboxylesterase family protein [Nocardia sp. GCM10030253]|uniref:carboxylesterase family protein n=1 Tax=Nocardia sp. GCM10030253 TaxID=3273404 RepID=UPI00364194E1